MEAQNFKPNLVPNNPKDDSFDRNAKILQNGGYKNYLIPFKKDGCRLEMINGLVKTRSLKYPKSNLVIERFDPLAELCRELNIVIDGEFYMHGLKFNAIYRFFSKIDVTCPKYKLKLENEFAKNPEKYLDKYDGFLPDHLIVFHEDLKFWLFDGFVIDRPDLIGFKERIEEIIKRLKSVDKESPALRYLVFPRFHQVENETELNALYELAIDDDWEGLILTHKDHEYKFGRNSLNQGTILKMKDDQREYDGVVIGIEQGDKIKEGIARTVNELGRSVTSKKKEDREPNGKAKGFIVQYEDQGTFSVGLKGFDDEDKKEIWENPGKYIGRHFTYKGMPPVKKFPRSVYFQHWRDEK